MIFSKNSNGEIQVSLMIGMKNSLGLAESALGATGCTVAREDEGMVESYWAQLPGNFRQRPRLSVINSRNFAGLASFHNFPSGRKHGNQWGDAIVMLRTTAGTPFFFNFHLTKAHTAKLVRNSAQLDYAVPAVPANEDGTDSLDARKAVSAVYAKLALEEVETLRDTAVDEEFLEDDLPFVNETRVQQEAIENPFALKPMAAAVQKAVKKMVADLGNTIVIGPPGSGKTVMQGALATFATKVPGMRIAVFDKDQGMELQVVANGGSYLRLKANRPSGIAPLQLEKNEANVGLNVRLVKKLCTSNGYVLTAPESEQISYAVNQVMERGRSKRRLRAVYDLMPSDSTTGARAQLKKWVYTGENAWLFDITDFLELPEVRSPLLMYIAHRVRHEMVRGMMQGSNRYLIKQGASSVVVELDLGDPSFANELSILSGTAANIRVYDEHLSAHSPC